MTTGMPVDVYVFRQAEADTKLLTAYAIVSVGNHSGPAVRDSKDVDVQACLQQL